MGLFAAEQYLPLPNGAADDRDVLNNGKSDARHRARGRKMIKRIAALVVILCLFCTFLISVVPHLWDGPKIVPYDPQRGAGFRSLLNKEYLGQVLKTYVPTRFVGSSASSATPPLRLAVIVKTGASTAYTRLPYHIFDVGNANATFPGPLSQVELLGNNIHVTRYFVSDHSMTMGNERVIDVFTNLTRRFKDQEPFARYGALQRELDLGRLPEQGDAYHLLDRYKFLAMHQYVFEQDPEADFQLAMDDDTVMFYPGLLRWLISSGYKPDEPHYLGTRKGEMADGGAGYLLSRAVLQALFEKDYPLKDDPEKTSRLPQHPDVIAAIGDTWCGDCSLAAIMGTVLKDRLPARRLTGGGWHFTYSFDQLAILPSNWHHPLFSLHHLNGKQTVELRQLESEIAKSLSPTDLPRICDAFLTLRPRFFDQIFPANDPTAKTDYIHLPEEEDTTSWLHVRDESGKAQSSALADEAAAVASAAKAAATVSASNAASLTSSQIGGPLPPAVTTVQSGPMLFVGNWVADNPDKHANMTVCDGPCLEQRQGSNDAERCSTACLGISSCMSWSLHGVERVCTLFHEAFIVGRRFDGSVSGFHMDRIRKVFGKMPCGDEKLRQSYTHPDMQASTFFPEQEGWTQNLA